VTESLMPPPTVPRPGALPYLAVRGAGAAIEFYRTAFGADVIGEPYQMGDGRIGHAELAMGGGIVYLADEFPDIGFVAPGGGTSVSLVIAVDDADAALGRFRAAGGRIEREPVDDHGSRTAVGVDPFGHRWLMSGPLPAAAATEPIRTGDVVHTSWWTPDADQGRRFYGETLRWAFAADNRTVRDASLSTSLIGDARGSTQFCVYAVADLEAALDRVRAAGGQADEPTDEPYGRTAMCVDNQGLHFALWRLDTAVTRPAANGVHPGDLCYLTYSVASSQAFRDFYTTVLGWTFTPGRVADGWEPADVRPMSGMHGGADAPAIIPMWLVDDIEGALERAVAAGGRVIEAPERRSYGISALAVDTQGGRFYLLQNP
jgi:predicted enzyme related to lactoylglutathione lyase